MIPSARPIPTSGDHFSLDVFVTRSFFIRRFFEKWGRTDVFVLFCSEIMQMQVAQDLAMVLTFPEDFTGSIFSILPKGPPNPLLGSAACRLKAGAPPLHAL